MNSRARLADPSVPSRKSQVRQGAETRRWQGARPRHSSTLCRRERNASQRRWIDTLAYLGFPETGTLIWNDLSSKHDLRLILSCGV